MKNLYTIIADVLRVPATEISEQTSMENNPLWDSLSHMEIIAMLEKKYSIEFSGDEIVEITSIDKIRDLIIKKGVTSET